MLRWMTAGESHGPALMGILDGFPAGVAVTTADVAAALARRRAGYGRGARQKFEADRVELVGGVRHGLSTGAPVGVLIHNSEWPKWTTVMSPDPVSPEQMRVDAGKGDGRELARNKPLTRPRPGHADLAGMMAYDLADARPVLERASARETAMRVALGQVARLLLAQAVGITVLGHVVRIGEATSCAPVPGPKDCEALDGSDVRCLDEDAAARMRACIDAARKAGDTLGGTVEVVAYGVPMGLGSHTQHDRRLDARLSAALASIQSVKAVEVGDGVALGARAGSAAHDEIVLTDEGAIGRQTNRAGGLEGGMTCGSPLRVRATLKPISTVPRALRSVDLATGEQARGLHQRSDTCAVVPAAVIAEAQVCLVLADALLEHVGGYSLAQVRANLADYVRRVKERL